MVNDTINAADSREIREAMKTLKDECPGEVYYGGISETPSEPRDADTGLAEAVICSMPQGSDPQSSTQIAVRTNGQVDMVTSHVDGPGSSKNVMFQTTTKIGESSEGDGGRWEIPTYDFTRETDDRYTDSFFQVWDDVPR